MSDVCDAFLSNPSINPRTGRKIGPTGDPYKKLVRECGSPTGQPIQRSPFPIQRQLSPTR